MISTNFYFNGRSNEIYGLYLVRTSNNMIASPYVPAREIKEDFPFNARQPFHYGAQNQPQIIVLTFSTLTNDLTPEKLTTIASWLFQDDYKEFYSEDNPEKIYYLMATGETPAITSIGNEGYLEVRFRSKFPYALTAQTTPTYEISGTGAVEFDDALCNVYEYFYPIMEITVSSTPTTITFLDVAHSRTTSFGGLTVGEVIYVDNNKKQIISSLGNYLYDDFNKNWLRLVYGWNYFTVTGNCTITFRIQYPVFT